MKHLIIVIVALLTLSGCNQEEVNNLKAQLQAEQQKSEKLEKELDEIKNGSSALLTRAKNQLAAERPEQALITLKSLITKHPASGEYTEALTLINTSEKLIAEKKAEQEKAKLAESKRKEAEIASAMKKLTKSYDKVRQITWYKHAPKTQTHLTAYIGHQEGGQPWLRQYLFYKAKNWLFVKNYILLIDDERITMPPTKFERDNGYGGIWEWEDKMATETDIATLEKIINSKETVIRFNGDKYYDDHTVTASEKAALKDVLTGYKALANI